MKPYLMELCWKDVITAPRALMLKSLGYLPASKCPKYGPKRAKKLHVNSLLVTKICPECSFWVERCGKRLITTWGNQKTRLGLDPQGLYLKKNGPKGPKRSKKMLKFPILWLNRFCWTLNLNTNEQVNKV